MSNNQPRSAINKSLLGISLVALFTYSAQFIFRTFDDNRLTSWQWAFQNADAATIFLVLTAGVILAFFAARLSIPVRLYPLFLFVSAFIAAAFFWAEPEVIVDASRYFTQAKHLELYGVTYFLREWGREINVWTDMPLVPFLYGLVFRIFGESRIYIQMLTTTFFALSVLLTYELGKTLWDEKTGFYGGLFLLGIPYLLTQAPLMLVDVPTMFFLLLAVVAFIRALQHGGFLRTIASSVAIALASFTKYSEWLMLTVLLIAFLVYMLQGAGGKPEESGGGTNRSGIFCRGFAILFIAALFIGMFFIFKFDVFSGQMRLLIDYQKPGLTRWRESFLSTFFFQIHPFITLAALYSVYSAIRKKDFRYAVIVWLLLLVVILQIKRIRYIIMVFPMLALMASYAIREIREREARRFFVLSVMSWSLIIGVFAYLPFMQKLSTVNLKDAGIFLDSLHGPYVEVFTLIPEDKEINPSVSVPLLDLFTQKSILYQYNRQNFEQPGGTVERSSLRFTWEYKNPLYYGDKKNNGQDAAVVVISDSPDTALPDKVGQRVAGYRLSGVFKKSEDIFSYRPCIRVYEKKK